MNKDIKLYAIMTIVIVAIILAIFYFKSLNNSEVLDESLAKCIAAKSEVFSQSGCSHCLEQKKIINETYLHLFNIIECDTSPENRQKCQDTGIQGTPTWLIEGKKYEGTKTIKELKEITGC